MSAETRPRFTPNLVVGLSIALVGIVLLLDRTGVVAAADLWRYWPVLLIVFGASVAVQAASGPPPNARERPIVTPGLAFAIALAAVLFSQFPNRTGLWGRTTDAESLSLTAVMGEDRHAPVSTVRDATLTTVMGRGRLDLRQARALTPGGDIVVDVLTLMGRTEIVIPDGWQVDRQAMAIMGAVHDERGRRRARSSQGENASDPSTAPSPTPPAASPEAPAAPTDPVPSPARVVLRGFVMMGALVIVGS